VSETQGVLFSTEQVYDEVESQARKDAGMLQAEENQPTLVQIARQIAIELCQKNGTTTADEVGQVLWRDHGIDSLGPAAGSVFRDKRFEFTGRRVRSKRVSNHARELKVWMLSLDT